MKKTHLIQIVLMVLNYVFVIWGIFLDISKGLLAEEKYILMSTCILSVCIYWIWRLLTLLFGKNPLRIILFILAIPFTIIGLTQINSPISIVIFIVSVAYFVYLLKTCKKSLIIDDGETKAESSSSMQPFESTEEQ